MAIEVFCCYSRKDQQLLEDLKAHLMLFHRQGLLTLWSDTDINAGVEWENAIEKHLDTADIILLLVSSDFMASDYCYSKEMQRAMERHKLGEAQVIPIILRPVHWQKAPFGNLQALPTSGKPVIDRYWHTPDEALSNIAEGILKITEEVIENLAKKAFENSKKSSESIENPEKSLLSQGFVPLQPEATLSSKQDILSISELKTTMRLPEISNKERLDKGYQYQMAEQYDEAMVEYRAVIRNAPELLNDVISNLRALLNLAPRYAPGYRALGDAYQRQGEYLQAMEAYNKALIIAKKARQS